MIRRTVLRHAAYGKTKALLTPETIRQEDELSLEQRVVNILKISPGNQNGCLVRVA